MGQAHELAVAMLTSKAMDAFALLCSIVYTVLDNCILQVNPTSARLYSLQQTVESRHLTVAPLAIGHTIFLVS